MEKNMENFLSGQIFTPNFLTDGYTVFSISVSDFTW